MVDYSAPCKMVCPACSGVLAVILSDEVTPVACECGNIFLAQHPDTRATMKKKPKKKEKPSPKLSLELLEQADDVTSAAVIAAFAKDPAFKALSKSEMEAILARDDEDDLKLAEGIKMAVAKGAVPSKVELEPLTKIDVYGKTADDVAAEIVASIGAAAKTGCVVVLQGLSGTGKGTTLSKLQKMLPRASAWSNGNIFRSITLLAVTYCESHGLAFSADILTPQLLRELVGCLHFERKQSPAGSAATATAEFDVRIEGLGIKAMVSSVQNTLLKDPKVSKNIPTVARVTQGEVISFAAKCADTMRAAGCNVLMEGRAQTLNFVRTPYRFELTLSKPIIIGQRRAAQRMVGGATPALQAAAASAAKGGKPGPTSEDAHGALAAALATMS